MASENIEYKLEKTGSGKYQQLACASDSSAIVQTLSMYGFGDCVGFKKRGGKVTFSHSFGLHNLGCFVELQNYTRLIDVPQKDIEKIVARMYESLFMDTRDEKRYRIIPLINPLEPKYGQIKEELMVLQGTQRDLVGKGKIRFPQISAHELECAELW